MQTCSASGFWPFRWISFKLFQVKLKKANRLLEFDAWPTRDELCSKIIELRLFHIPHDQVIITALSLSATLTENVSLKSQMMLLQVHDSISKAEGATQHPCWDPRSIHSSSTYNSSFWNERFHKNEYYLSCQFIENEIHVREIEDQGIDPLSV
jgi:hypothetical protein